MLKPQLLLNHLLCAVPAFATAPDQLSVLVMQGRMVAAGAASLSFEYQYTVQLTALDFAGHPDAIVVPLLAWLRTNQPELADNPDLRAKSIRFEAQLLKGGVVDLIIEVDLTERVLVTRRPAVPNQADPATTFERWDVRHLGEPPHVGATPLAEYWEVYGPGDELLSTWDIPADRL